MSQSPFKFLDSYTKDDREIFFGREREVEELYQKVFDSKILLIYGVSGTGKTSLINCGLANKFQDSDWLPISIRRGKDIVQSLADELNSVEGLDEPRKAKSNQDRILKSIRSIYLDYFKPIYLLFDQFEEIFIFGTKEERKEFALIIKSIAESDLSCKLLFSIREEYLASLTEMERYIPSMLQNRFRVERMNRQNAISVIEGPCKKFGISVEEGFPDALLDRLGEGGANIELTYLQVYLDRIYRTASPVIANEERVKQPERSGARRSQSVEEDIASSHQEKMTRLAMTFSISILDEIGDIKDLLGTFLNEQVAKMENPELANSILKSFVSAKGTKKQLSIAEATESVQVFNPEAKAEKIRDYIVDFVNLRILRGEDEEGRYELRHDSLAAKIFEKISADEMELLEVRQFIENAYLNFKTRQIMLSPDDFEYIGNREKILKLSIELQEFVNKSHENIRVKKRTVKRLTFFSAVALVILLFAVGKYVYDSASESQANTLAHRSLWQYKNVEHRIALAILAYQKNISTNSTEALIRSFNHQKDSLTGNVALDSIRNLYLFAFKEAPEKINHIECTKKFGNIFGYTQNFVILWDSTGKQKFCFKHEVRNILAGKISYDEQFVALLGSDSLLNIFNITGIKQFYRNIHYLEQNPQQAFAFLNQNSLIISNSKDVVILDAEGKIIQTITGHLEQVNAIAVSKDYKFIASVANDTTVKIWYYNSVKKEYNLYSTIDKFESDVWSVNFSGNGKMVVTTSETHGVSIITINNSFPINNSEYYKNNWREGYPNVDKIKNKTFYYAEFSDDDYALAVKSFEVFNGTKKFCYLGDHFYWVWKDFAIKSQGIFEFDHLAFSPNKNHFTYSLGNKVFIAGINPKLPLWGNQVLFETKGEKGIFSNDGNFLYTVNGKQINQYVVSGDKIQKILGEINFSEVQDLLNPF